MKISYPYQVHYVSLPGNCRIAYMDEGQGERTLLFIHGLANYAPVWQKNIAYLKQYYRCIAIDLPGNGLSDQEQHRFSMNFFADVIFHFIEALGLTNVVLAGHSMGGQVALTVALKYPTLPQALVLCAPAGFETFTALDKTMYYSAMQMFGMMRNDEQDLRTTMHNSLYRTKSDADGMIQDLLGLMKTYKHSYYKSMIDACIKGMLEEPVLQKLHTITCPALVLFGRNDALIPNKLLHHTTTEQIARDGVSRIPNAAMHIIDNCGHFVQWENADDTNRSIILFLESGRQK